MHKTQTSVAATPISNAFLTPGLSAESSSARTSPAESTSGHVDEAQQNSLAIRYNIQERAVNQSDGTTVETQQSFAAARSLLQGKLGGGGGNNAQKATIPAPPPPPPPPPPPGHASRALEY